MRLFQLKTRFVFCLAVLVLQGCVSQNDKHNLAPAYRPHSENSSAFLEALKRARLSVYPSIVRTIEGTSYSTKSQQQIIERLREAQLTTLVEEKNQLDPGKLTGKSQWEIFINDKQGIVEDMQRQGVKGDYSLVMEILFPPGNQEVFGIHCYVLDSQGENAFSFLLNSHHQLFSDAKLRADDASLASRELLIEKATRVGVSAFIQQVSAPLDPQSWRQDGYTITTQNISAFDKNVEKLFVVVQLHKDLVPVYMHSLKHSMESAFETNGVKATIKFTAQGSDGIKTFANEIESESPEAILQVTIDPLYRERKDGYQAIVGTVFNVSLINTASAKEAWHANGKVDYIKMFGPTYTAHDGIRKEFAWTTTAAIVRSFMMDVNARKSAPIYTVTEDRQFHGQNTD